MTSVLEIITIFLLLINHSNTLCEGQLLFSECNIWGERSESLPILVMNVAILCVGVYVHVRVCLSVCRGLERYLCLEA